MIGIAIDLAMSGWAAGGVVSRTMALSFAGRRRRTLVFLTQPHPDKAPDRSAHRQAATNLTYVARANGPCAK